MNKNDGTIRKNDILLKMKAYKTEKKGFCSEYGALNVPSMSFETLCKYVIKIFEANIENMQYENRIAEN